MSANPHGVRRATPYDLEPLREFVPKVLIDATILPPSQTKVDALIERCCYQVRGAIAGIIDGGDGSIMASIGMIFTESETSDRPYITAAWCGLSEQARRAPYRADLNDPRGHFARRLFEFARWCHGTLEEVAGEPVLVRFDVLTLEELQPKMRLYSRNLTQIGASYALGVTGSFQSQTPEVAEAAA